MVGSDLNGISGSKDYMGGYLFNNVYIGENFLDASGYIRKEGSGIHVAGMAYTYGPILPKLHANLSFINNTKHYPPTHQFTPNFQIASIISVSFKFHPCY